MEETKSKLTLGRKECHWVSFSSFMAQPEGRPKPTLFRNLKVMHSPQSCCLEEIEDRWGTTTAIKTIKKKSQKSESPRRRETSPVCSPYTNIWLVLDRSWVKLLSSNPEKNNSIEIWAATHHWGDEFYNKSDFSLLKKKINTLGKTITDSRFSTYTIHDIKDTMQSYSTCREFKKIREAWPFSTEKTINKDQPFDNFNFKMKKDCKAANETVLNTIKGNMLVINENRGNLSRAIKKSIKKWKFCC